MTTEHLFFDLDNTLWDHRKNAFLTIKKLFEEEKITEKYNIVFEDFHEVYHGINEELWAKIRDGKIDKIHLRNHRFYDTFASFGIENRTLSNYFEDHFLDKIIGYNHLIDGTLELLDHLKSKGYTLHILSNGFQEVTERKCVLSEIDSYFSTITSADEINIRKPKPEIFLYALEKANAKIENSVMIGDDWIADIEGALALGIRPIFFDVLKEEKYSHPKVDSILSLLELKNKF